MAPRSSTPPWRSAVFAFWMGNFRCFRSDNRALLLLARPIALQAVRVLKGFLCELSLATNEPERLDPDGGMTGNEIDHGRPGHIVHAGNSVGGYVLHDLADDRGYHGMSGLGGKKIVGQPSILRPNEQFGLIGAQQILGRPGKGCVDVEIDSTVSEQHENTPKVCPGCTDLQAEIRLDQFWIASPDERLACLVIAEQEFMGWRDIAVEQIVHINSE